MLLGFVLRIGGGIHGFQCIGLLALGVENPRGRDLALDIHHLRPIGVLGSAQLGAQLGERGDVGLGRVRLAGARRPQCTRKVESPHRHRRTGSA